MRKENLFPFFDENLKEIPLESGRRDIFEIFEKNFSLLTKRQWEIVQLYYGLDVTQEEIAEKLGIKHQSVSDILHQARQRILKFACRMSL